MRSLHGRLRAATAEAHAALERDLDWEARTATLTGYADLLARLHGFHAGYEPAIGQALDDEAFFGERRRLACLEADLSGLGFDGPRIAGLPHARPIALDRPVEALGALYVLEGSTLGGQVIGRALERRHGARIAGACAYYCGRGRRTAAMWAAFCKRLDGACTDAAVEQAALAAGIATFGALRAWLLPRHRPEPHPIALRRIAAPDF